MKPRWFLQTFEAKHPTLVHVLSSRVMRDSIERTIRLASVIIPCFPPCFFFSNQHLAKKKKRKRRRNESTNQAWRASKIHLKERERRADKGERKIARREERWWQEDTRHTRYFSYDIQRWFIQLNLTRLPPRNTRATYANRPVTNDLVIPMPRLLHAPLAPRYCADPPGWPSSFNANFLRSFLRSTTYPSLISPRCRARSHNERREKKEKCNGTTLFAAFVMKKVHPRDFDASVFAWTAEDIFHFLRGRGKSFDFVSAWFGPIAWLVPFAGKFCREKCYCARFRPSPFLYVRKSVGFVVDSKCIRIVRNYGDISFFTIYICE